MPVLNQVRFLEAAIRSVLLQGYPHLQVVVIDGGSTDGSVEIIRRYASWLHHWQSAPDNGQYAAINAGFAHTTGAVMAWLNGDDMLAPDGLRQVGAIFADGGSAVQWIVGTPSSWDEQDAVSEVGVCRRYSRYALPRGCYEGRGMGWIQQESVFWTRRLWEAAGARVDERLKLAGDFELWLRFSRHAELHAVRDVLSGIRRHDQQRSGDKRAYAAEVDDCLSRLPDRGRLARLIRVPGFRRVLRFVLRRVGVTPAIAYDAADKRWRVQKEGA
ncbi:MAG: glycosyltransferase [Lentisphaerae bacterium]|nr:glycosyltransferase [Lentisphaerota bacterium]